MGLYDFVHIFETLICVYRLSRIKGFDGSLYNWKTYVTSSFVEANLWEYIDGNLIISFCHVNSDFSIPNNMSKDIFTFVWPSDIWEFENLVLLNRHPTSNNIIESFMNIVILTKQEAFGHRYNLR